VQGCSKVGALTSLRQQMRRLPICTRPQMWIKGKCV
jgi:hypothetical protein